MKQHDIIAASNMVKGQLMPNNVTNEALLDAMELVPREHFIDQHYNQVAYIDDMIPISSTRSMIAPHIFAKMAQSLEINHKSKVMDVGCATGYSSIVLSHLSNNILGIESDATLLSAAESYVTTTKNKKVRLKHANLLAGDPSTMPFDAIMVNGVLDSFPTELISQLVLGGKLVFILDCNALQKVVLCTKLASGYETSELFEACGPKLQ